MEYLNFVICSTERAEGEVQLPVGKMDGFLEVLDEDEELCYAKGACALVMNLILMLCI